MSRKARLYTRIGDDGTTRLAGGQKVPKTHPRIAAYGGIDELNAMIGVVIAAIPREPRDVEQRLCSFLLDTQRRLFELGAELACLPEDQTESMPRVCEEAIVALEAEIDALDEQLPRLEAFILPGGSQAGAALQLARTVCRRVEIDVLCLHEISPVRKETLKYINRLSDYLFVAGRVASRAAGEDESTWRKSR